MQEKCVQQRIGAVSFAFPLSTSAVEPVLVPIPFHNRRIKRRENILRTDRVRIIIVLIIVIIGSISLNLIQIYSVDERSAHIPIRSTI